MSFLINIAQGTEPWYYSTSILVGLREEKVEWGRMQGQQIIGLPSLSHPTVMATLLGRRQ
jgi:hypothetical protein